MHDSPSDRQEHEAVLALLPWEANGTSSGDQHARVAAHLLQCAQCRDELQLLERSFALMSRTAPVAAARVDAGWHRMAARLDRDDARHAGAGTPAWRQALRRAGQWLRTPAGWGLSGPAVAIAAVTALVIGYPLLDRSQPEPAPYSVLTSPPSGSAADAAYVLRVKFKADTSPALLTQWLAESRTPATLRRESGSLYLVELAQPADFQAMNRVFEQLSRHAEVDDVQIVVHGK